MFSKDTHIFLSLIPRPHLYRYDLCRFLNVEISFTTCKKITIFFLQNFDVHIFPCTPVPVGISMYFVTNIPNWPHPLQDLYESYLFLLWGFAGTGTPTYFYRGSRQIHEIGPNIVFLLRKGSSTEFNISKCKKPAAAFQLLTTSKDFDSAPRAH